MAAPTEWNCQNIIKLFNFYYYFSFKLTLNKLMENFIKIQKINHLNVNGLV